jgi:phosphatidylserine/phosphatidylglycerophosphate/cardiolipin synthase-like enzyme
LSITPADLADRDREAVECALELWRLAASSTGSFADVLASLAHGQPIRAELLRSLFQWAYPAVQRQATDVLLRRGVLLREGRFGAKATYRLADATFAVAVRVALRTLERAVQPPNTTEPALYVTPTVLLEDVPADVGEIRQLLIELVANTRERLRIVTPFFSDAALHEVLFPLQALPPTALNALRVELYLSLRSSEVGRCRLVQELVARYIPAQNIDVFVNIRPNGDMAALPHAKLLLCDSQHGYLGSANISLHGLREQFEVGLRLSARTVRAVEQTLAVLVERRTYELWKYEKTNASGTGIFNKSVRNELGGAAES